MNLEGRLRSTLWATPSRRVALQAQWDRLASYVRTCVAGRGPAGRRMATYLGRLDALLRRRSAEASRQAGLLLGRLTRLTGTRCSLPTLGHLRWNLTLWVNRLGPAGVVGLGLCAFAAMAELSAVSPLQEEQARLSEEIEAARSQTGKTSASSAGAPRTPGRQLSDFYATFPPLKAVPETLRKMNRLAETQHLVLETGDYHVTDDHTGRLVRYDMSFPIAGPYPNVRRFLRAVLAEIPNVALDKVDVEKSAPAGAEAKTIINLTLFVKRDDT